MKYILAFVIFFTSPLAAQNCDILINLEYAINRALTANRQILSSINALQSSQLKLELAYSEFDFKMKPYAKGGYSGGGSGGSGLDIGYGATWEKKYARGAKLYVSPFARRLEEGTSLDLDASFTQPLFKGFNREYNLSTLKSAQYSARTALRTLHTNQVSLINKTITTLYEIVRQEQLLKVHQSVYDHLLTLKNIFKQREKRSIGDSLELNNIEIELTATKDNIDATENKLKDYKDNLRELLVLGYECNFQVDVPMVYNETSLEVDHAIEIAMVNRTEIEQSCDEYGDKSRLTRVAKEGLKPELNLVLKYNDTGYDRFFRDIGSGSANKQAKSTWTTALETNMEYSRTSDKIAYRQSLLSVESSCTSYQQSKEKVELEVIKAIRNLKKTTDKIQSKEKKIRLYEIERKLAFTKYEKGLGCSKEITNAEKNLGIAQASHVTAIIDHIVGEYALKVALGTLLEKPIVCK